MTQKAHEKKKLCHLHMRNLMLLDSDNNANIFFNRKSAADVSNQKETLEMSTNGGDI